MASKTVKVNLKSRPKGDLIEVPGLGLFENGKSVTLSDEQIELYEKNTGYGERKFPSGGLVLTDEVVETKTPYREPQPRAVQGGTVIVYDKEGAELLAPEGEDAVPTTEEGGK